MAHNKLIVIFGASGSGKTTLANTLSGTFTNTVVLCQDDYYFGSDKEGASFDDPSALDFNLLEMHLNMLINNKAINSPIYNHTSHKRENKTKYLEAKKLIFLEGTMVMNSRCIRKLQSYSIYCDIGLDICFIRRLSRDMRERGRDIDGIIKQYLTEVRPSFFEYINTYKDKASFKYYEDNIEELYFDMRSLLW